MDTPRKPLWSKIVATVVVLAVLYPLSAGPVAGLQMRRMIPEPVESFVAVFYKPIGWMYWNGPQPVHKLIDWYYSLWAPPLKSP